MEITAEIPKIIEEHWPISDVSIVEVIKNKEQRKVVVKIKASEGLFIYRVADPNKQDSLDKELFIFDFLRDRNFHAIAKLTRTNDGKLYREINGICAYILAYVDGIHPKGTPEIYHSLGTLTAKLHSISGYPYKTEFDADYIAEHHLSDRAEKLPFRDEYLTLVKTLPKFNNLPKVLTHTDIGTHNTIQRPTGELVIIDWDDVGIGPAVLDVGFLLMHFMNEDCVIQEANARSFYRAYFSMHPMTEEEKNHLFDAGLFIALNYIIYGDVEKRWRCIQWAIKNRDFFESVFRD